MEGYLFLCFFAAGLVFFGFLVLSFPVSPIFSFSVSLFFSFSAFSFPCFPCFSAFPASLLFCFLLFLFSLLLCFCTSGPFYFWPFLLLLFYFFFLQSCVFAALLPAPLRLCFLSLQSFCFSFSFALFWSVCIPNETLERPQVKPKKTLKILIRNPT